MRIATAPDSLLVLSRAASSAFVVVGCLFAGLSLAALAGGTTRLHAVSALGLLACGAACAWLGIGSARRVLLQRRSGPSTAGWHLDGRPLSAPQSVRVRRANTRQGYVLELHHEAGPPTPLGTALRLRGAACAARAIARRLDIGLEFDGACSPVRSPAGAPEPECPVFPAPRTQRRGAVAALCLMVILGAQLSYQVLAVTRRGLEVHPLSWVLLGIILTAPLWVGAALATRQVHYDTRKRQLSWWSLGWCYSRLPLGPEEPREAICLPEAQSEIQDVLITCRDTAVVLRLDSDDAARLTTCLMTGKHEINVSEH